MRIEELNRQAVRAAVSISLFAAIVIKEGLGKFLQPGASPARTQNTGQMDSLRGYFSPFFYFYPLPEQASKVHTLHRYMNIYPLVHMQKLPLRGKAGSIMPIAIIRARQTFCHHFPAPHRSI